MKPWTAVLIVGTALVFVYEVRANVGNDYPTLTALLRDWTVFTPAIAFMFGFLMGHLFWSR